MEKLTAVYNRSRSDYMVPMQMTASSFRRYMHLYDVDLEHSVVAMDGVEACGIGMLGLRPGRAWITRLGVTPEYRRAGVGAALVHGLLDQADARAVGQVSLEVIEGNGKAELLFRNFGFRPCRRLLVLERQKGVRSRNPLEGKCERMPPAEALERLRCMPGSQPWKNQVRTYQNAGDLEGLVCRLPGKTRGWLVFRKQPQGLSHYAFRTEAGSHQRFAKAVLAHLHRQYPKDPAQVENVCADDPHLPAFFDAGYTIRFCRVEMERK